MNGLMSDADVIQRVFDHIDNKTTDLADRVWREPVASYLSDENFSDEIFGQPPFKINLKLTLALEFVSSCQALRGLAIPVELKCFVSAAFSIV